MATPSPIGVRVARLRDSRDLTQEELAERAGIHVDTIRRLEQDPHAGARMTTYQRLADALDVELGYLLGQRTMTQSLASDGGIIALRNAVQAVGQLPGMPQAGPDADPPATTDLRATLRAAQRHYQAGRFTDLVTILPGLISDLADATRATENRPDHAAAWSIRAAAHIIVADVAAQLGHTDLAYLAVERALAATERASDPLRHALAVSTLSLVLLRQGRWLDAEAVATQHAEHIEPRFSDDDPDTTAMYGVLLLSAAVPASRAKRAEAATTLLKRAKAAATLSGPVKVRGTTFGPASVGMQATTVHVSLGQPIAALREAALFDPADLPWEISRARHRLDIAHSRLMTDDEDGARELLLELDTEQPEWIEHQVLAATTAGGLLERERRRDRPLRRLAAKLGVEV
jgi:transcriptional regulator with XRE-family HTH domain